MGSTSTVHYVYRCGCQETVVFDWPRQGSCYLDRSLDFEPVTTILDEVCHHHERLQSKALPAGSTHSEVPLERPPLRELCPNIHACPAGSRTEHDERGPPEGQV